MKQPFVLILLMTCSFLNSNDNVVTKQPILQTDEGVGYETLNEGFGSVPTDNQYVFIHYTFWIDNNGELGTRIDSSNDRKLPVKLQIGKSFFRGCDAIIKQMKVGATYRIYLPSQFAYGEKGLNGIVPPNTNLILDLELLSIQ